MSETGRPDRHHHTIMAMAACPFCGAALGEPCRTARGRATDTHGVVRVGPHAERLYVAKPGPEHNAWKPVHRQVPVSPAPSRRAWSVDVAVYGPVNVVLEVSPEHTPEEPVRLHVAGRGER